VLEEELFDSTTHDRAAFSSGEVELDQYLQRFASQHIKKGVSVVRVLVNSDEPSSILGFYSLSAAQVDVAQTTPQEIKKLPRFPVPCFRMGRLAVASSEHGRGYGRILVGLAISRCLEAKKHIAGYALIVEAKHEQVKAFYQHCGFTACAGMPLTLYLPLGND
jgi:GNAT superfamily N-acetyltransferase